jgi:hypothetical protein
VKISDFTVSIMDVKIKVFTVLMMSKEKFFPRDYYDLLCQEKLPLVTNLDSG